MHQPGSDSRRLIRFGTFEVDLRAGELRKGGVKVRLTGQPFQVLTILLEHPGEAVSREELQKRLWPDTFVDVEHNLNAAINKIREALSDSAESPRFVETLPRRGYRFIAVATPSINDVSPKPDLLPMKATSVEDTHAVPMRPNLSSGRSWRRVAKLYLIAPASAALLLVGWWFGWRPYVDDHSRAYVHSLAVLPLESLSGDPEQNYFADGMTDELITALAKNRSLRVISRTSVMQYKGVHRPLTEIAKELGVDGILEGSVGRSGSRVHMTVQLIYAPTDTHIWAESYDRDIGQMILLPSELSQTIAKEVKIATSPARPPPYINPEAYDAYLRGRFFWFSGDSERSRQYFEKAIHIQPDYAAALGGLADAYLARALGMQSPPQEVMGRAEAAARKAVASDDSLVEVHTSLAGVYFFYNWDWKRADAEAVRAIALNPNYAEVHPLRATILLAMNRSDEALQEQRRSTELDSVARPWGLGKILIHLRQFDTAVNELNLRAEAAPQDWYIQFLLSDAYRFKEMGKESARALEQGYVLQGDKEAADAVHETFESGGERAVAQWMLNRTKARARKDYVSPLTLAHQTARLKKKAETLKLLEDSYRERSPWLVLLQNEPDFDFLHSDERYRTIVKRMGLPMAY